MSVGTTFAVIAFECVKDKDERKAILESLTSSGHEVLDISFDQVLNMCGNVLEVSSLNGRRVLAMSTRAYTHFTEDQRAFLLKHVDEIVHADISTIENIGGGSVRCMMGELF
jgi:hypothetical protein